MADSIFTPRFTLTEALRAGIERIERRAWLVEHMLLVPNHQTRIERQTTVKRASGTTAIEGVGLPEEAVARLLNAHTSIGDTEAEQANINALRAYEFVDYLSDQADVPIDELAIREMNRQLMWGAADVLTPGAYRKGQNRINSFAPPNQGDVPDLMRALGLWLREPDEAVSPVVRAGLAHLHFVAIHPFWDGNGRTARGLTTLVLQRSAMHFRKLLSLEATLAADRDAYINAIERTLGDTFAESYDATTWLEFFVDSVDRASLDLEILLTEWHQTIRTVHERTASYGLKPRQTEALTFAAQLPQLTRKDYMEITGVRELTATRDLAALVERGLLAAHGRTRDRTYTLT
jgi:Fic family protein